MKKVGGDETHDFFEDENGVVYHVLRSGIDFNDWSFVRKKRFDRIDRDKVDSLNHLGYLGREKWKKARDEKKTMDLRRWGYNG